MSKVFIIPDVHLKPWMFIGASELIEQADYDAIVMLGDLVDDWGQDENRELYKETFDEAIRFVKEHQNTFFCYGNHDISYVWELAESGYSWRMRDLVVERLNELVGALPPENVGFLHSIDGVLFSHAGVTEQFVEYQFGLGWDIPIPYMLERVSRMDERHLWTDESPIWARPQYDEMKLYSKDVFQVVGHTPVGKPFLEGNLLTLDTFSTYRDGTLFGNQRFVWVDTVSKTWHYAD
ncbi:Calcineurin-like phosphoesterase [Lachnospiraceae bacterium XBB2008]|nr:Calcineurin-like phosphoesterase [Lachnospiraceae bacterium XBB2008]